MRKIFTPIEKLGKFINKIVNTLILSIVYLIGVGFTYLLLRFQNKEKECSGWESFETRDLPEDYQRQF